MNKTTGEWTPTRMLTVDDVANWLNVGTDTVYSLLRKGTIRATQIPGSGKRLWRIKPEAVEEFLDQYANDKEQPDELPEETLELEYTATAA